MQAACAQTADVFRSLLCAACVYARMHRSIKHSCAKQCAVHNCACLRTAAPTCSSFSCPACLNVVVCRRQAHQPGRVNSLVLVDTVFICHVPCMLRAGQPYVIVFCGVNGVGKSTNLAKIAYWLGSQGLKVQLAACDTFRAGAVEQLKTHAAKLGGVSWACAAAVEPSCCCLQHGYVGCQCACGWLLAQSDQCGQLRPECPAGYPRPICSRSAVLLDVLAGQRSGVRRSGAGVPA